ncbi:MAG: sugar ABC transporter ATP-binding protein [Fimbriimonadaceae bacterium]|nr:sugar ABC transporter ATP-binding protein [Fimbriimonadaceae bacterium]
MALLEARGIRKAFGANLALDNVDFTLDQGEIHALVGENGSGKSTLMRILHGELAPDAGTLTLDGKPYAPRSVGDAREAGVALVHQELAVCAHLTVAENIFLGQEVRSGLLRDRRKMDAEARRHLGALGVGDLAPDRMLSSLSPAQRQLVEIARAMMSDARVVLFDEPTSSLGQKDVGHLFEVVKRLASLGKGVVYISHFLDEVKEVCDRATFLRDGVLVGHVEVSETDTDGMTRLMAGREIGQMYVRSDRSPGEVVLSTSGLHGPRLPLGVDLELRSGEVLGLAGLNGSGRTEYVRCLFGLDRLKAGKVSTATGRAVGWPWAGMVSEDRKTEGLAQALSIADNLTLPRPGRVSVRESDLRQRTDAVVTALNVKCRSPWQPIGSLSGGNQQKVAIGRLFDQSSSVWFLDEPTRGIDVGSKAEIYKIIDRGACEGKAVLLVSSHLPELLGLCDRIAVFRRGEVVTVLDGRATDEQTLLGWCTGA